MPSSSLVELSAVTLRLGDTLLFRDTDWAFSRNQNWLIVGGNGAGKTIFARAIAGEIPVVQGEISYGFRPTPGKIPEDHIAFVSFEQQKAAAGVAHAAERWFSVEQSVSVNKFLSQEMVEEINPFEVRPHRERTPTAFRRHRKKILYLLQIQHLMHCRIPSLSNGEMRKVLIARALLRKPRLLILDDAFAGLDARYRVHLKCILENLMKQGFVRILLVDSLPREIPRGITNIMLLDACELIAHGPVPAMLKDRRVRGLFQPDLTPSCRPRPRQDKRHECPAEELARLENAFVRYNGRNILSGVTWTIRRGESWALIGPNGAGKSTILSLINGDNPQAYANEVYLFGRRRGSGESVWNLKKRIGFISSELHLHFPDDQSCLRTVLSGFFDADGCYKRPSPEQRRIAHRMLDRFGLGSMAKCPLHLLSTGSQRMVLLARALVKNPDLLLMDEPCQGLDPGHRKMFLQTIESQLRETDTTVVYVTHRMDEIPKGIRRVLRLRNGRIIRNSRRK